MARSEQVKALVRSHAEGDDRRFYAIAMQVAASAARAGHSNFAKELRELVDIAKSQPTLPAESRVDRPVPLTTPQGELAGILSASYPKTRLGDMILEEDLAVRLQRVVQEQRRRSHLRMHGFEPQRKLLLTGPPGTGKTMTASALAGELGLPLFNIQVDGLITKFMGETAAKLRLVFNAIEQTRGVYLFDEFDALGSQRGATNDVGEIRRVLNSFLQFLEQDDSDSLIIGATNHADLLDTALFRRFDAVFEYDRPSENVAIHVMQARLALLNTDAVDWDAAALSADTLSHAEITRACEQAAKNILLNDTLTLNTESLTAALNERRRMRP